MTTFDHGHWQFHIRGGALGTVAYMVLGYLRLPRGVFISSGPLPHDPECTATEGVVRG